MGLPELVVSEKFLINFWIDLREKDRNNLGSSGINSSSQEFPLGEPAGGGPTRPKGRSGVGVAARAPSSSIAFSEFSLWENFAFLAEGSTGGGSPGRRPKGGVGGGRGGGREPNMARAGS